MIDSTTILDSAAQKMQKSLDYFQEELLNVRAGKASTSVLNSVMIESYGSSMAINQVASVTVPDARTIIIQPWDKNMIAPIEKAIINSNIGLTPSNSGESIRLNVPPLTEERRKMLVKQVRGKAEDARVSLRNTRRDVVESLKRAQKDGMAEDAVKDGEAQAQKLTDKFNKRVDEFLAAKEAEIMTV